MAKDSKGGSYISDKQSDARVKYEAKKQEQADDLALRELKREQRTDEQQLARLDEMFGKGLGAKRERARLTKRIAKQTGKKEQPKTTEV